jgi:hypothetical protein
MIRGEETLPFPSEADLGALVEELNGPTLRGLLAREGVYLLSKQQHHAGLLTRFVFGEAWYAQAFRAPVALGQGATLTGVRASASSATEVETTLRGLQGTPLRSRYEPVVVRVFQRGGVVMAQVDYTRVNPYLTTYYRRETHQVEMEVRVLPQGVEFVALATASTDAMVVRDVALHVLDLLKQDADATDIRLLLPGDRVGLFDALFDDRRGGQWRVTDVHGLTIRNDEPIRGSTEEKLNDEKMKVLSSAVLNGSNLRDHELVAELLTKGYFFSAAEFKAARFGENATHGEVHVEVNFKQNPEVLVVTARGMDVPVKGDGDSTETVAAPRDLAIEAITHYWSEVHRLHAAYSANRTGEKKVSRAAAPKPKS